MLDKLPDEHAIRAIDISRGRQYFTESSVWLARVLPLMDWDLTRRDLIKVGGASAAGLTFLGCDETAKSAGQPEAGDEAAASRRPTR